MRRASRSDRLFLDRKPKDDLAGGDHTEVTTGNVTPALAAFLEGPELDLEAVTLAREVLHFGLEP